MVDNQEQGSSTEGNPAPDGANGADGSATAGNPDAGTVLGDGEGSTPPDKTQLGDDGAQGFDWAGAGLEADNLSKVEAKGWKNPADVIKGYSELEQKLGEGRLEVPDAETADQEAWDAFYNQIGRPEAAEEYKFQLPEGVPEDVPYDNSFADQFRHWAHKSGLSSKQANDLHGQYLQYVSEQAQASFEALDGKVTEAHNQLVGKWGNPDTDEFKGHVESATRAMRGLGIEESLKASGLLHENGAVVDAKVAFALDRIGAAMFKEDTYFSGETANANNPFTTGRENYTQQSSLIANDPQRAAHLIRAAGKDPKDYNLTA